MQPNQMPEEVEVDEDHPAFAAAMKYLMQVLYEKQAAKDVAQGLKAGSNPVEALANTTYEIVAVVDERTDGEIPDELFGIFAARALEEVVEIAEAAGVQVDATTAAEAMREMILRYAAEQGHDTTQLQQAMQQVNPQELAQYAEQL
jgi:hypothetical protein